VRKEREKKLRGTRDLQFTKCADQAQVEPRAEALALSRKLNPNKKRKNQMAKKASKSAKKSAPKKKAAKKKK
jgi:hypothetical protein